jgi:carboxymethylenebutenolidase
MDAVVDCWGGRVVMTPAQLNTNNPVAPIDYTPDLPCPILGIFGNDDRSPSPDQVDLHEQALIEHGKNYEFHRYPDAGHGFFYYHRPNYRQEQAVDGWAKIWAFLAKHLT